MTSPLDDVDSVDDVLGEVTGPSASARSLRRPVAAGRGWRPSRWLVLAALLAGIVLGVTVSSWGQRASAPPSGHPTMTLPTATPVDAAALSALEAKAAADPADAETRAAIAAMQARAGSWDKAVDWQGRVVALRPDHADSRLLLGTYLFNNADLEGAEREWLEVVKRDPKNAAGAYNLGFLYLSRTPPDAGRARASWQQVIDVAPGSDLAIEAAQQLAALAAVSPTPSAQPS